MLLVTFENKNFIFKAVSGFRSRNSDTHHGLGQPPAEWPKPGLAGGNPGFRAVRTAAAVPTRIRWHSESCPAGADPTHRVPRFQMSWPPRDWGLSVTAAGGAPSRPGPRRAPLCAAGPGSGPRPPPRPPAFTAAVTVPAALAKVAGPPALTGGPASALNDYDRRPGLSCCRCRQLTGRHHTR
jgi:hypothetical protein